MEPTADTLNRTLEVSVSEMVHPPKSDALKTMFYRSEILQVMYWLRGEKLGHGPDREECDALLLERFIGVDANIGVQYLDRLVTEGYLERTADDRYVLSDLGRREGGLEFAESFSELTRPTHGECSADCWCHNSPEEADACAAERAEAHAGHEH